MFKLPWFVSNKKRNFINTKNFINKKLLTLETLYEIQDYCQIKIPKESDKIPKNIQVWKSNTTLSAIYADNESLL